MAVVPKNLKLTALAMRPCGIKKVISRTSAWRIAIVKCSAVDLENGKYGKQK